MFLRDNEILRDRRVQIAGAVVIIAAIVGGVLYFGGDDEGSGNGAPLSAEDPVPETGQNVASSFEGKPDSVLFLADGTQLLRRDLKTLEDEEVAELEGVLQSEVAPASPWLAYVSTKSDDELAPPTLYVLDMDSGEEKEVTVGQSPTWDPAGQRLAYLKPRDPEHCDLEVCPKGRDVYYTDPESLEEKPLITEDGLWTIVGWAGEYLLVGNHNAGTETLAVNAEGETKTLDIPFSEVVAPSPDGRWILRAGPEKAWLVPLSDGEVEGDAEKIDVGTSYVASATWSNTSETVAVILGTQAKYLAPPPTSGDDKERSEGIEQPKPEPPTTLGTTRLATLDPDDPEFVDVPQTFSASGDPLWMPANDKIFVSIQIDEEGAQTTYLCKPGKKAECSSLFTFARSPKYLRTE